MSDDTSAGLKSVIELDTGNVVPLLALSRTDLQSGAEVPTGSGTRNSPVKINRDRKLPVTGD
jgi:hypothetical protein